jgi:hypothetical protein
LNEKKKIFKPFHFLNNILTMQFISAINILLIVTPTNIFLVLKIIKKNFHRKKLLFFIRNINQQLIIYKMQN